MDVDTIANALYYHIEEGELREIKLLLDPIVDKTLVEHIENQFLHRHPGTDPVNLAITHKQEHIAFYLVEKEFSTERKFHWDNQICDQWCLQDHGIDICAAEYTASDHAEKQNLYKLNKLINEIRQGKRKPGQSLAILQVPNYVAKSSRCDRKLKMDKPTPNLQPPKRDDVEAARKLVKDYDILEPFNAGNSLLHLHIDRPKVYIYILANAGVPVNIQNVEGDTALHLAVRRGLTDAVEALLQCCADINIRNQKGMTPLDEVEPSHTAIVSLLNAFKPGIVKAVNSGLNQILDRLVKHTWCSVGSIVKDGRSLLKLAEYKAQTEKGSVSNCLRILKEYRKTSELIHAVLCEDVETARNIIQNEKGWVINVRFRDRIGKTLLSHAVECSNLELVTLLVEAPNGAKIKGIRVREHEGTNATIPLFHKSLHPSINPDIAKYLNSVLDDPSEHSEKDQNGNTAVLLAIENNCSTKFVQWLIQCTNGYCLTDRNKDGLSPKELAKANDRDDIVKMIDKFLFEKFGARGVQQCATHFFKDKDVITIKDELTDKTLADKVIEDGFQVQKWLNFHDVQNHAIRLFEAAASGKKTEVEKLFDANYKDKNGYTALTRAIVFQQEDVCRHLCTIHPVLKSIPDNCNRYPLHYAYSLPEPCCVRFTKILFEANPKEIETKVDKDGRSPADYRKIRDTLEIRKMLYDARTLDAYGKRGPPLAPWPEGAENRPPDENQPMDYLFM